MITLIILTVTYLLSIVGAYKYVQTSFYRPSGQWNILKPTVGDVLIIWVLFVNSILSVGYILGLCLENNYTNFFKK